MTNRRIALFDMGFRPFFLLGPLFSIVTLLLWVAVQSGWLLPGTTLNSMHWHIHEMVYGFAGAVVTGFILTASANWVGMRGLHGLPLVALVTLFCMGRITYLLVFLGSIPAFWLWIDCLWLPVVFGILLGPLWQAGKWRNTGLLGIFLFLWFLQVLMTLGFVGVTIPLAMEAPYLAVGAVVLLIVIVGGRLAPIFTKNRFPEARVVRSSFWDWASLSTFYAWLVAIVVFGWGEVNGWIALFVSIANLARMIRWGGLATLKEPLYLVMHVAYAMIPLSFAVLWLSLCFNLVARSVALHLMTTGVIGFFILGMITRVSKGHTGRPLEAGITTTVAFIIMLVSIASRTLLTHLWPEGYLNAIHISSATWVVAFLLFLIRYLPILCLARPDGRAG